MVHTETLEDADHLALIRNAGTVEYALGSGRQGISFLITRGDGYLFASPLCWFPREHGWDLSPGYKTGTPRFERPVRAGCLYCHANQFELREGTENHYRTPIFRGHSIGCERCHGPGEEHVREPAPGPGVGPNIVNPARLDAPRREGVCQQCHLQAEARIQRAGRSWTDYRPGELLHETIDVYLKEGHDPNNRFVGQVEQMYSSRCFAGSKAALGCISCHDPHSLPEASAADSYYRSRCLTCHATGDGDVPITPRTDAHSDATAPACSLPRADRLKQSPEDSCTSCHMPRSGNRRIAHTTTTDHRIPRRPGIKDVTASKAPAGAAGTGEPSLVSFFHDLREADRKAGREDPTEKDRDLGIALSLDPQESMTATGSGAGFAASDRRALTLLNRALREVPDDADALDARGRVLKRSGMVREALESFRAGLELQPRSEELLFHAAGAAVQLDDAVAAQPLIDRLIEINPYRADYFNLLASARTMSRDWKGAEAACRSSLALNAFDPETRFLLVQALLQSGDGRAESEFQTLVKSNSQQASFYREWYSRYRAK
jgi:predicted CXXCH cytochrome family protein